MRIDAPPSGDPPLRIAPRTADAHKGTFGDVLIIAGSRVFGGAARLAASGCALGGAGLVRLAVPRAAAARAGGGPASQIVIPVRDDVEGRISFAALGELRDLVAAADVLVAGPGLGRSDGLLELLRRLLRELATPAVLDADALNLVAELGPRVLDRPGRPAVVLTPHPGEAARLLGLTTVEVQADRGGAARALAEATSAVVVLKGAGTLVAADGRLWTNGTGNPGMASGGAGDVLAGLIGALLASPGLGAYDAARLGVWAHGRAGDLAVAARGELSLLPEDLLDRLPEALRQCRA